MTWLFALTTLTAFAVPPVEDDALAAMAERFTEKLGVTAEVAETLTVIVAEHREAMAAHRALVKPSARALREARKSGDTGAMKKQLKELRRLRERSHALQEQYTDDVLSQLTVEQQARWVLARVHRQTKRQHGLPENPR